VSSKRAIESSRAFVELGSRVSRDTLIYAMGTSISVPASLLTTAYLTRHFPTGVFGQMAILFAVSGVLVVIMNLIFLQGSLMLVFVQADVGVDDDWVTGERVARNDRPVMLTTGLCITATVGVIVATLIWQFSEPIARVLLHDSHQTTAVTVMGFGAACGAVWRYVTNVTRYERKPGTYGRSAAARPIVALTLTIPFTLLGFGLTSPFLATLFGSVVGTAMALRASHRSYALDFSWRCARRAFHRGLPWVPVVAGLFMAHSGDLLLLRVTATNTQLGIYRIADAITSVISYGVSAFHLAQVPLEGTLTAQSAYQEHRREQVMANYVLSYLLTAFGVTLILTLAGSVFVGILAPGYEKAVDYIPITSLAYLGYGWLLMVFRAGDFYKNRIRTYAVTAMVTGTSFVVLALVLMPQIGIVGAPAAAATSCFGTGIALLILGFIARHPLPLDYGRIFGSVVLAVACWALGTKVGDAHGAIQITVRLLAIVLYPVGLVVLRIIPRDVARQLPAMVRAIFPRRRQPTELIERVDDLPYSQRDALIATAADHLQPSAAAARLGVDESTVLRAAAAGLRRLAGGSGEFLHDDQLALYLISNAAPADRDEMLRNARSRGTNMLEFRAMERVYHTLEKAPRKLWTEALLARYDLPAPNSEAAPGASLAYLASSDWVLAAGARAAGSTERDFRAHIVRELRRLSSCEPPGPADQLIAQFLLDPDAAPATRQLWAAGIDPVELHRLDLTLRGLRARGDDARARRLPVPALPIPVRRGRDAIEAGPAPAPALAQFAGPSGDEVS
jgi:O-antigen/teichoic acid export membrane protein